MVAKCACGRQRRGVSAYRHFVPNLTLGAPIVKALRKHTDMYLDCHLMVSEPGRWVEDFRVAGAHGFTFHVEAADTEEGGAVALCRRVREAGMRVGVAVKPGTDLASVLPLVDAGLVDMVLVMTVEPGFGGQSFMADMMPKVEALRARYPALAIQVDGGISDANIAIVAAAGANVIVAGTSIFKAEDPASMIRTLRAAVDRA